jgi:hypothetical protein
MARKFGLLQYAQRFAENDITFAILPDLTDEDRADRVTGSRESM